MPRFLKVLLIALTGALAGCGFSFMLAETPLGSQAVVLDPKELNGVWAAYAKIGDRYEANDLEYVLFFRAKDSPPGAMELLVAAPTDPHFALTRFDVLVRQHNGVTFANFRLRQSGGLDPADDPKVMMRAVRVSVVEKLSGDELRVRLPLRVGEWIQQGRLPGRLVNFDPFREGWTAGAEWMLGQLTPEHLDAITTPDGLDWLFPTAVPDNGEKREFILRKIRWPPPVQSSRAQESGEQAPEERQALGSPMYSPGLELAADYLKDGGTKFSCRGANTSSSCDVVVYRTLCSARVDKGGKPAAVCTHEVVEEFSLPVGDSREFRNPNLSIDSSPKTGFCLKTDSPRRFGLHSELLPPFCSGELPANLR